jgi:hypothetical protein
MRLGHGSAAEPSYRAWPFQANGLLIFIPQYKIDTATKDRRYVDGALVYSQLRLPFARLPSLGGGVLAQWEGRG